MEADLFEYWLGKEDQTTLLEYLDSPKLLQAKTNSTRLWTKLRIAVENLELYETQQIIRTIYFRLINNPEQVEALLGLLYFGAIHQLERLEQFSGQDLAILFLETSARRLQNRNTTSKSEVLYHLDNGTLDIDICRKVSSIAALLPDTETGRTKFIAEALRLLPPTILNRDLLHEVLATRFYKTRDYANARYHFLHSACVGRGAVHLLVDFQTEKGTSSEVDLFITQFSLQFLCLQQPIDSPVISSASGQARNQRNAVTPSNLAVSKKSRKTIKDAIRYIFLEYVLRNQHPNLAANSIPFKLPLLNFIYLLISILDSGKSEANAFKFLVDFYEKAWSRDPNYQSYLNRIGVLYFGLADPAKQQQQQAGGGGGFFNNILMSLLDGPEDDDEEDASAEQTLNVMSSYDELD